MTRRVITFEFSRKRGKRTLYGRTESEGSLSHIWIDDSQNAQEMLNTLFHEFTHTVIHWFGNGIDGKREEEIARLVGNVAEPCFRNYGSKGMKQYRRTKCAS